MPVGPTSGPTSPLVLPQGLKWDMDLRKKYF